MTEQQLRDKLAALSDWLERQRAEAAKSRSFDQYKSGMADAYSMAGAMLTELFPEARK